MRLIYPFDLPKLPYEFKSMNPYISEWTMQMHYEKNHKGYVDNLNEILKTQPQYHKMKLAYLLTQAKGKLFDMSAQHFNHVVWWFSLKPPQSNNSPPVKLLKLINRDFGSLENWKNDFVLKSSNHFGSGWIWLCLEDGKLVNSTTNNAGIPNFIANKKPLLVCDLWEHSYFCQYTTDKKAYINAWFNCINWEMAQVRLLGEDKIFNLY